MRLAAALVLWAAQAGYAQSPAEPKKAVGVSGDRLHSVHALIERSYPDALAWSKNAKIYTIQGQGPKSKQAWLAEQWTITYGDPLAADGFFLVKFTDGEITFKKSAKGSWVLDEYYWNGKLQSKNKKDYPGGRAGNYAHCLPIDVQFIDTPRIENILLALKLQPNDFQMYGLTLSREKDYSQGEFGIRRPGCRGLTPDFLFKNAVQDPELSVKRSVWGIEGGSERLFLDAGTAQILERRPLGFAPVPPQ